MWVPIPSAMRARRPVVSRDSKHGVFVASFLKGFVVCSCSSFAFPDFRLSRLWVKCVNFFLTWTHSVWYDVVCLVCFLLGYWHDIGWKCTSVKHICLESSGNCCLETRSRKLRVLSHLYFMRSRRCQIWSTSMLLSLRPGTSRSFEEEHFRDKHRPGFQFHRRWGREGLLCPGIPSGCSWCLCRQFGERFCSLLMLILRISRFQILLTVSEVGELILTWTHFVWSDVACFLLGYWHDIGWKCIWVNDICPESSGSFSLETQSRKLRVVSHLYFTRSHGCQPWSTSRSMSLSLWLGTGWRIEEHLRDKHQIVGQSHRRWGSTGLLCPGIPSSCSWCHPALRTARPWSKWSRKRRRWVSSSTSNSRDLSWAELVQKSTPAADSLLAPECARPTCFLLNHDHLRLI